MAEIKIEKKKPIWPWILGLLLLGLLIYFLAFAGDDEAEIDDMADDTVENIIDNVDDTPEIYDLSGINSIAAYKTYIANPDMSLDHEYSHGALSRLIEATKDVAEAVDVDIKADLDAAHTMADHITKNPYDVDHADKIKKAAGVITRALKNIQNTRYPNLSAATTSIESAINGIKPGVETLEQKQSIKNFYQQAANLLTKMQ